MGRKQVIRWAGTAVAVLVLFAVFAGYMVLESPQFHQYVLAKIVEQVDRATGGKLEVENWDFHLSPMVVNLYGITLHGTEGPERKPLLVAEKLTVGVSARGLFGRKVQLTELLVQHPVARVEVNQDGTTNIPTPTEKTSATTTITVWNLAVAHALLSSGEVYCNDQENNFSAELYDLRPEVRFDPATTRYTGSVSYRDGWFDYGKYAPLRHNLDAQFSATPSGASLNSLVLTIGSSRISLQGEIRNYSQPEVDAAYDILVHTQDFAALSPRATPAGDLRLAGKFRYANPSNQPPV
jgi:translocation and assembly module TamB